MRQILREELRQRTEEGCDTGEFNSRIDQAPEDAAELLALYHELVALKPRGDFAYHEPSDLDAIRAARPAAQARRDTPAIDDTMANRIHGAWLGRCAGLVLGKPFESWPFVDHPQKVRPYLEASGDYPLCDYARNTAEGCKAIGIERLPWSKCQRGQITHVEPDDDIHYTITGLDILEAKGAGFTTQDVAHWWTHNLTAAAVFTAEEAAYRNLMAIGMHHEPNKLDESRLVDVREWMNPWREWIGAQIRADGWAYACPGNPERAAEFAWRDARLSHIKNGIYGEMFCAAMIAAAAVCDDPVEIVHAGLGQIPERCRLAEAVRQTIDQCAALDHSADRFEAGLEWLWQTWGVYHPIHTINNAAAVVLAILLGGHDFERVITIAVMAGWDTDCNGATAGSVCGMMLGASRLPAKWISPLQDTLRVGVPGYNPARISECAKRHVELARAL